MKKICIIFFAFIFTLGISTVTLAESSSDGTGKWEVSLQEWDVNGSFDYNLHFSTSSQTQSKVSFGQDQLMTLLNVKYTLPNDKYFVRLQYGQTGNEMKGRGSDTDWYEEGGLQFYGDMDSYGEQSLIMLDFGRILSQNEHQQTTAFIGLAQQKTNNEMKNMVYHIAYGKDIGDEAQSDAGNTLNGKFEGFRLGMEKKWIHNKWSYSGMIGLTALETDAYGTWTSTYLDWKNVGYTLGWTADVGVEYALTKSIALQLGYYGNFAKNYYDLLDCNETQNGSLKSNRVCLNYEQQGIRCGVKMRF